jgi:hypothetical protein
MDWLRAPFGSYWTDFVYFMIWPLLLIATLVYIFKKNRIHIPNFKSVLIVCVVFWQVGMLFGGLYSAVWYFDNNAFIGLKTGGNFEFVYYSFVTITTLGYGDIEPVSYLARWLSVFEACVGLFFISILIAVLISRTDKKT